MNKNKFVRRLNKLLKLEYNNAKNDLKIKTRSAEYIEGKLDLIDTINGLITTMENEDSAEQLVTKKISSKDYEGDVIKLEPHRGELVFIDVAPIKKRVFSKEVGLREIEIPRSGKWSFRMVEDKNKQWRYSVEPL